MEKGADGGGKVVDEGCNISQPELTKRVLVSMAMLAAT